MKFSGMVRVVEEGIGSAMVQIPNLIVKGVSIEEIELDDFGKEAVNAVEINHDNKMKIISFILRFF